MELIENCKLNRLKPFQKNPRKNDGAVDAVAKSIEQFGAVAPIIVNQDFEICAGHTRFKAATQIGKTTFPVIVVDLKGDNFTGYNIADNQTASIAEWNTLELAALVKELDDHDFDVDALGFDGNELQEILDSLEDDMGKGDPDDVPDPPKVATSKLGDLYILGDHRVLCGDATKPEDVEWLMDGAKADMVFTDPPYALFGNSTGVANVTDDKMVRPFFRDVFAECQRTVKLYGHIYVCCDWHSAFALEGVARERGLTPKNLCVWDKGDGGLGTMYQNCYELVWFFANSPISSRTMGAKKIGAGERVVHGKSNIWRYPRETTDRKHNAQKPVDMLASAIANSTDPGESCCDFFLGSGTTLIACEQLNRKCYGMEIEPIYIDVIVKRWETFTGKKAVLA